MKNIIEKYTNIYFIKNIDNKSYIFLLFDYLPFNRLDKIKYAEIDAYYFVSNASYSLTKKLIAELKCINIFARLTNEINVKKILVEMKVATSCLNTLCYVSTFGSKFVVQVLEIYSVLQEKLGLENLVAAKCCNCINVCPSNAITKQGFKKENCLRFLQENSNLINETNCTAMSNKLLGCDECQRCCPMNKLQTVDISNKLKNLLSYENLLTYFEFPQNIKKDFEQYIGKNYARKKYFYKNILCCIANSKNKNLVNKLKSIKNFVPNDLLKFYHFAINKLENAK